MRSRPEHVVLVGAAASGEAGVGRLLATALRRPFLEIGAAPRLPAGSGDGREASGAAELAALRAAAARAEPAVIAAPRSLVEGAAGQDALAEAGAVVHLGSPPEPSGGREGAGTPALAVDVGRRPPSEVVAEIVSALRRRIVLPLRERGYEVVVGPGARALLPEVLPAGARHVALVTQAGVPRDVETGRQTAVVEIGTGERAKSLRTIEELCRAFARAGLRRSDAVVALGGGVVCDTAGFAAACYLRGVALVNVATTLLAQVDAAIGGKTGVNLPEGKNLVGAFWQPSAVLCDTDLLASLPEREWRSGLGEVAKYAFLGAEGLERLPLVDQVARCVELKASVVAADEREAGPRMALNYGHTLAHALEAAGLAGEGPDAPLRHGEAVALGVAFAARLAERLGRIPPERVARHLEVLAAYGLPSELPAGLDAGALVEFMARDKKARGEGLTFVLDGPDGVEPVHGVPAELVVELLERSAASGARRTGP
ncbi:MAG TPA: 3-dehydroquinate synthase family protein [Acidimicrobiales bacterium]|nr:3-dehydroquinate synthase family protein [Acidimicrobiales bacterium]